LEVELWVLVSRGEFSTLEELFCKVSTPSFLAKPLSLAGGDFLVKGLIAVGLNFPIRLNLERVILCLMSLFFLMERELVLWLRDLLVLSLFKVNLALLLAGDKNFFKSFL
jgi:hypothetical protein